MIKRKAVRKVELILGIIILTAGIIGLLYLYSAYNQFRDEEASLMQNTFASKMKYIQEHFSSNETKYIATFDIVSMYKEDIRYLTEIFIMGLGFIVLSIMLSLILILEGLANISDENKK